MGHWHQNSRQSHSTWEHIEKWSKRHTREKRRRRADFATTPIRMTPKQRASVHRSTPRPCGANGSARFALVRTLGALGILGPMGSGGMLGSSLGLAAPCQETCRVLRGSVVKHFEVQMRPG